MAYLSPESILISAQSLSMEDGAVKVQIRALGANACSLKQVIFEAHEPVAFSPKLAGNDTRQLKKTNQSFVCQDA